MLRLLSVFCVVSALASPALAQSIEERIVAQLEAQGYHVLEEGRTWLGRLRIVAENDEVRREIVVNPGTGEVLRDYSVLLAVVEMQDQNSGSKHDHSKRTASATASAAGVADPDLSAASASEMDALTTDVVIGEPILPIAGE